MPDLIAKDGKRVNSGEWWETKRQVMIDHNDLRDNRVEHTYAGAHCLGGPVLELGFAFGMLVRYLPQDVTYVGWDIAKTFVHDARKGNPNNLFLHVDILEMDLNPWRGAFKCGAAFQVLEHFEDLNKVMFRLRAVVTDRLILSVPRGLPTDKDRRGDGHVRGWEDEEAVIKTFSVWGGVSCWGGKPNHICATVDWS